MALAVISLLVAVATAAAISAPIHIANTGGEGVFIRPEPNTSHPAVGWMPEGASPDYHCFAWGQDINGVPIWFNVTYNGKTGYYASYFDDSSYHSNEELTAKYGVPLCGSALSPSPPPTPSPPSPSPSPVPTSPPASAPTPNSGSDLVYSIMNAPGGVYFRRSTSWGDTSAEPGVGVYDGDRVELICGELGEAYGPYANRWWSYVKNLSRASAGEGWVNAHFIDDGMPANHPSPGEGTCGSSAKGTAMEPAPAVRSVFFWPRLSVADRPKGTPFLGVADMDVDYPEWHSGGCNPDPPIPLFLPESVNTLAGWSLSRLAPVYFLIDFPGRRSQIQNIILFDPGSLKAMQGGCDETLKPSVTSVLAKWLKSNPTSELLVLTGKQTEDKDFWGHPKYHGLWNFYFHDIWPLDASIRSRVKVCDYNSLLHEDVLNDFYQLVKATGAGFRPDNGCPVSAHAPGPTEWSP